MKQYVVDTHALLWHLFAPNIVGSGAKTIFAPVDQGKACALVPAVVVAEALMVAEKRRIKGLTTADLLPVLEGIQGSENYRLCPLMPETVIKSRDLIAIPEIFDRLIAAEAIDRKIPLLTRDPVIQASGLVTAIWD